MASSTESASKGGRGLIALEDRVDVLLWAFENKSYFSTRGKFPIPAMLGGRAFKN